MAGATLAAMNYAPELLLATCVARAAGGILRRFAASGAQAGRKPSGEVVTRADLEADRLITAALRSNFPGDEVFSEESPDSPARLGKRRVWIVDPLDSTSNFLAGGDNYCVSIGMALDHRPVLGVVYNPARDELYAGAEGITVTLNGKPQQVSAVTALGQARVSVSRKEWERLLHRLSAPFQAVPLASMAYKLARLAAGLEDGVFCVGAHKQWGTCAGVALVLAAGGTATLPDGRQILFNLPPARLAAGLVAAGPSLHPKLLEFLRQHPADVLLPERASCAGEAR